MHEQLWIPGFNPLYPALRALEITTLLFVFTPNPLQDQTIQVGYQKKQTRLVEGAIELNPATNNRVDPLRQRTNRGFASTRYAPIPDFRID